MILIFLSLAVSIPVDREMIDSSFIKIIDDRTMRDTIKSVKSGFVFFHADHQRVSDVAYANYVEVADKYKSKAKFFVVPASQGSDVARTYSVPGNPCLMHFRLGTKTGIHYGMFSKDSVERFISNWTKPRFVDLSIKEGASEDEILSSLSAVFPDRALAVILLSDNSTKFGRANIELADELGNYFPFARISDPNVAKTLNARYPSLMILRFEDSQKFLYTGEPDVDEMFIWTQHNSIPSFRKLELNSLFSPDGVSVRSAIAFLNTSDYEQVDVVYPILGGHCSSQNWVKIYYADQIESRAVANLFGISKYPSMLLLSANYTHSQYAVTDVTDNETFTKFYEEKLELKTIPTPSQLYGDLRPVTEFAFEKMLEEGPFFTLFTSAFCVKCKGLKVAAFDAAQTIRRNKGNLRWALWDVTQATPSFQQNISLGIPSLYYFPTPNYTEGITYVGPPNFLSIIEWVHGKAPESFDLDEVMSRELGGSYDEI